jgi:guanylate kinase
MAKIFFLMGVSGSGKTTVLKESGVLERNDMYYVQSYTTRPLRDGEKNGEKYHHVTRDVFQQSIDTGEFLEWAIVHQDYLYGTKIADVQSCLDKDISVIKELEMYGLQKIVQDHPDLPMVSIFLDVDDVCMQQRINGR